MVRTNAKGGRGHEVSMRRGLRARKGEMGGGEGDERGVTEKGDGAWGRANDEMTKQKGVE